MRYLTRQVAVDAIQWDGREDTFGQIRDMVGDSYELDLMDEIEGLLQLDTSTGTAWPMKGDEPGTGDWVVWDGEYAHCYKYEQFQELFAPAVEYILDAQNVEITFAPIPKTQEEKVAFRQYWDSRVERGIR